MAHITTRYADENDRDKLIEWLMQEGVLRWFPLTDLREVEDAARIWLANMKCKTVLTALYDGEPCGIANLYLQPYKKLAHQCLFAIIVDEKFRGKGVGTRLLTDLMTLAGQQFQVELLHLEAYDGNPAIRLYQRIGFEIYGRHKRFIKEKGQYTDKILMQKRL